MKKPPDDGTDLETRIRALLADYPGNSIDFCLVMCYNDGKDKSYIVKHKGNGISCRRLCRILWQALIEVGNSDSKPPDEDD